MSPVARRQIDQILERGADDVPLSWWQTLGYLLLLGLTAFVLGAAATCIGG